MTGHVAGARLLAWRLLAGEVDAVVRPLQLDWRRALGVHLWCPCTILLSSNLAISCPRSPASWQTLGCSDGGRIGHDCMPFAACLALRASRAPFLRFARLLQSFKGAVS